MENKGGFTGREDKINFDQDHVNNIDTNIIDYLNEEIAYIQNKKLEPGWTIWAIIATISSLVWLLFNELEKQQVHLETVFVLILIIEYLFTSIYEMYVLIVGLQKNTSKSHFRPINFSPVRRLDRIVYMVRYIGLIYITYFLQSRVNQIINILAYISNIFWLTLFSLAPLTWRYFERERTYVNESHYGGNISNFAILLLNMLSAFLGLAYLRYAFNIHLLISISDIRLVGLIIAIIYLALVWSRIQTSSPILDSLIEIRRDYRLGRIDTLTAKKHIDVALFGLPFEDVTKEQAQMIMQDTEDAEKEIDGAASNIHTLSEYYRKIDSGLAKSDKGEVIIMNKVILNHFKKFASIMRRRALFTIFRLIKMYSSNGDSPGSLTALRRISGRVIRLNERFINAKQEWKKLLEFHETKEFAGNWTRKADTLKVYEMSIAVMNDDTSPEG